MDTHRASEGFGKETRRKPVPSYQSQTDEAVVPAMATEPFLDVRDKKEPMSDQESISTSQSDMKIAEGARRRGRRRRSLAYILRGWWQEILCCGISIAALVALVLVLCAFDGNAMPSWSLGITINTVIAFLSTMSRAAFVVPVEEGLSQCKWNWFKKKPRPLRDLEVFDEASRGPLGSFKLLARTKGWLVGIISAFLLVTGIATSTLTQSAVTYPSRNIAIEMDGMASAWKLGNFYTTRTSPISEMRRMAPVTRGIARAIYAPTEAVDFKPPECLTTNCTWPRFSTLAVCHDMTNLTHLVEEEEKSGNLSLPNGVQLHDSPFAYQNVIISPGPSFSYNGTQLEKASIFNYFVLFGYSDRPSRTARAVEVILHWCVNTYDASVENNVLSMNRVTSHTEVRHGDVTPPEGETENLMYLTSPGDRDEKYIVDEALVSNLTAILGKALSGQSSDLGDNEFGTGADMLLQAESAIKDKYKLEAEQEYRLVTTEEGEDSWWGAVDGVARNVENGLVNGLLDNAEDPSVMPVNGTAWSREVYVHIRWPWLALLASQILLSILLLVMIIRETAEADVDIVKSSTMAALFAIGAHEKAGIERRLTEGEPLTGEMDECRLRPVGIGGELRKKDGKWALGEALK